jgi:CHAT domain-containing protein
MKEFYTTRQSKSGTTKAEALRNAQLALLNGTADTKTLPETRKVGGNSKVKLVVVPGGSKQNLDSTRAEIVYISEKDAPLFTQDSRKPFAHPYYWSPFVLFGNWR